jgi:hypothetical protein
MVLGLPDPDPVVRGTDPDPDPSLFFSHKCVERTEIIPVKNILTQNFNKKKKI